MRLLILLLVASASASPHIASVVPDLPGPGVGEGIEVHGNFTALTLTDGESSLRITQPGWYVSNRTAWYAHDGPPATEWPNLRLANDGETVHLMDGPVEMDSFAYGPGTDHPYSGPGAVLQPNPGMRVHRIGESAWDQPTFVAPRVTAYASPDSSYAVLHDLISSAQWRLVLHIYDIRDGPLVDALVESPVPVDVLVDKHPIGLWPDEADARMQALTRLLEDNATVVEAGEGRYRFHHLKVLIADDAVAIQSENWTPNGVPENPSHGNRGWGVVVHDSAFAQWTAAVLAADRVAWDTQPVVMEPFEAQPRFPPLESTYKPVPAHDFFNVSVTPLVSPDHTAGDPYVPFAGQTLRIQHMDLSWQWTNPAGMTRTDPLLAYLPGARLQAAAPFNSQDTTNQEILDAFGGRDFHREGLTILHNKGIVGDNRTLVGSMNGNDHSRTMNREFGVILDSPELAAYYRNLFDADWSNPRPRDWSVPARDVAAIPATPLPILLVVPLLARLWSR